MPADKLMSAGTRIRFVFAGISKITFAYPFLILSFFSDNMKDWVVEELWVSIVQGNETILNPMKLSDMVHDWMKAGKNIWLTLPDLPEGQEFELRFLKEGERKCIKFPLII